MSPWITNCWPKRLGSPRSKSKPSRYMYLFCFFLASLLANCVRQAHAKELAAAEASDIPLSWDYVMCFEAGSEDDQRTPNRKERKNRPDDTQGYDEEWDNGMTKAKYYGQIFYDIWKCLEDARLTVRAFRSRDSKFCFLVIGITERNLKLWADDRDTDLLLDPANACEDGRNRGFPLALRTKLVR